MTRLRPSPAMVVAVIALIASVTSGAYAAVRITTRDIADGAVTQRKLAHNAVWNANLGRTVVRTNNVRDGAVTHHKLSTNAVWNANLGNTVVRTNNIRDGAVTSSKLDPQVLSGFVSDYTVFSAHQSFGPRGIGGTWCGAPTVNTTDQGWKVIGGGARWDDPTSGSATAGEWPSPPANNASGSVDPNNPGWVIQANGTGGGATVYVICIKTRS